MNANSNKGIKLFFVLVLAGCLSSIGFIACGSKEESTEKPTVKAEPEAGAAISESTQPADWQTKRFEDWSVSFPKNWNGDEDAGVWWPGEGSMDMGRPPLSVHLGGIPLMPGTDFVERVKLHIHGESQDKKDVKVSGISGFICTWEFQGNKHRGIFLEEKISAGMSVIHFVDCQAPSAEFENSKSDFEKIIASFKK